MLVNSSTPAWLRELGVRLVEGSVTSPERVAEAVEGVSEIYHLAGFVSHLASDAHRMYSVHVDGTRLVCDAAVKAGVRRIVMASTSGTIAVSKREDDVADESSQTPIDLIARWPYYASKHYQEETARPPVATESSWSPSTRACSWARATIASARRASWSSSWPATSC